MNCITLSRSPAFSLPGLVRFGRRVKVVSVPVVPHRHPKGWRFLAVGLLDPEPKSMGLFGVGTFQVKQRPRDSLDATAKGLTLSERLQEKHDVDLMPLNKVNQRLFEDRDRSLLAEVTSTSHTSVNR